MGFSFMPFTLALVFYFFFLPFGFFFSWKEFCFIKVSLLPAHSQLHCYFHRLKVIVLLLVHFLFVFFLFHSLVVMSGYLFAAACLLYSFSWILFVPSTYVYMCLLNRKVLFIVVFSQPHLALWVAGTSALLCSQHALNVSFEFSSTKWG